MKDPLYRLVKPKLDQYLIGCQKVLLACSGGADSIALTSLVWEFTQKKKLQVFVVYVDHGLRKEVAQEIELISKICQQFQFPFKVLSISSPIVGEKNLEEKCREKRYAALKEEYQKIEADALLTAHHGNDLIETMLKRLFEGARIEKISSMKHKSDLHGICLIRPLLYCLKKEILQYLERKSLPWAEDSMNEDLRLLRNRMRADMMPFLEKVFGKK